MYLDDILVLVCSKWAGKGVQSLLCSLLVCLGLHINFSKSYLCLTQTFCFLGQCWDTVHMSVSLPPDKLADIQHSLSSHVLFMQGHFLCQWPLPTVEIVLCHLEWHVKCLSLSNPYVFSSYFSFSALCQLEQLSHLQQSPVHLEFPLPVVVIATDVMPTHWAFYPQGSGLTLSVIGSWSGSLCRTHCLAGASGHDYDAV